jgi:hypothetical protein
LGLGGLRERFLEDPLGVESSEAKEKCFGFTGGIGGCSVGDCADNPYLEVFFRITLGGEDPVLPFGVEKGDAR